MTAESLELLIFFEMILMIINILVEMSEYSRVCHVDCRVCLMREVQK